MTGTHIRSGYAARSSSAHAAPSDADFVMLRIAACRASCDMTRNLGPPLRLQTLSFIDQSCPACAVRLNCDGFVDVSLGPLDT